MKLRYGMVACSDVLLLGAAGRPVAHGIGMLLLGPASENCGVVRHCNYKYCCVSVLADVGIATPQCSYLIIDVSPRNGWACNATMQLMGFWMSVLAVDGIAMLHCS